MRDTSFYDSLLTGDIQQANNLSLGEKALYGVGSALISGGVSLANSAAYIVSRPFSDQNYQDPFQTEDVVDSFMGSSAAAYYKENQLGLDALGQGAAMLIPGTAGVKALRMAQGSKLLLSGAQKAEAALNAGRIGNELSFGTWLRPNVYAEQMTAKAVDAARNLTEAGGWSIVNAAKNKAIAAYAFQGALEGVAFEYAAEGFMQRSIFYDKDSLEKTMIWNPLLSGSLGGIAGAIGGRITVYAKGGLKAAEKDMGEALTIATLGYKDFRSMSRFPAEDIGLFSMRGQQQQEALAAAQIGAGVDTQKSFAAAATRVSAENDKLLADAVVKAVAPDTIAPEVIYNRVKEMPAAQVAGTFSGVRRLSNVSLRDVAAGADEQLTAILYVDNKGIGRASAEFSGAAADAALTDSAKAVVSLKAGTKVYTEAEALLAKEAGIDLADAVIKRADGTYYIPGNLKENPNVTIHSTPEVARKAGNTVQGIGSAASMDVVLDTKNFSIVTGNLIPTVTELVGVRAIAAERKVVLESGQVLDFSRPTFAEFKSGAVSIERSLAQNRNHLDAQTIWLRAEKFAQNNPNPGRLDKELFQKNVAYADQMVLQAKQKGLPEIRLASGGTESTMSIGEAEANIAARKQKLMNALLDKGVSREAIESRLNIKFGPNGVEDIEKFVAVPLAETQAARYVKAEVNVEKADALLNNIQYSQRMLEESRSYQMIGRPLGESFMLGELKIPAETFPAELNLTDAFGKPSISPSGNHAGFLVNSPMNEVVVGMGQVSNIAKTAARKIGQAVYTDEIVKTANFITDPAAVQQAAVIRTLYSQRIGNGAPGLINFKGETFVIPANKLKEFTDLAVRLERAAAKTTEAAKTRVETLTNRIAEIVDSPSAIKITNKELAAHLETLARNNHRVESAAAAVKSFQGKEVFDTSPNKVFFPSPDPLENPFTLFVRMPGIEGAPGDIKMFLTDKATFDSRKAQLLKETSTHGNDLHGGQVLTTADIKANKALKGEFDSQKDFLSAQFDSQAEKAGKLLDTGGFDQRYFLNLEKHFIGRWEQAAKDAMYSMYPEFQMLEKLHVQEAAGRMSTLGKASRLSNLFDIDRSTIAETKTTYSTLLDVMNNTSREDRTALPGIINRASQAAYDRSLDAIRSSLGKVAAEPDFVRKVLDNTELDAISSLATKAGANVHAAEMIVAATKSSGSFNPQLTSVISKINALSNFFTLRLDAMHSVMNAASMPITALPHFRQLLKEISTANGGKLPDNILSMLGIKAGEEYSTITGAKVFAQKAREFFVEKAKVESTLQMLGVDTLNYQHAAAMVDLRAAAFAPDATLATYQKVIKNAASFVKENRVTKGLEAFADHSEAFTQYVAGRTGYEIALAAGKSEATARLFAAGFAQQVNNSINLGARHSFYNGPAGMLVGLYQNYMRGMITRSLQFMEEGNVKALVELAGLQGAMFGARGLPLFDFYNRKILGENSKQHADAFTAMYGVNGQLLGDFIAYGAGSSLLGVNLFTRGDLTPMAPTLLPTPWDSPAAKTLLNVAKLGGNVLESIGAAVTGDGNFAKANMLHALEHNNINRPIGRMAAMLQGYSTTVDGKPVYDIWQPEKRGIMGGIDIPAPLSAAVTLAAGIAGSSTTSEALTKDVLYRMTAYQLKDKEARRSFTQNMQIELGKGTEGFTNERYAELAAGYIRKGGTLTGFEQLHARALATGQADPITNVIKKDPANNIYNYAKQILGPSATMNNDFSLESGQQ